MATSLSSSISVTGYDLTAGHEVKFYVTDFVSTSYNKPATIQVWRFGTIDQFLDYGTKCKVVTPNGSECIVPVHQIGRPLLVSFEEAAAEIGIDVTDSWRVVIDGYPEGDIDTYKRLLRLALLQLKDKVLFPPEADDTLVASRIAFVLEETVAEAAERYYSPAMFDQWKTEYQDGE